MHNTKVTVSEIHMKDFCGELLVFYVAQKEDGSIDSDNHTAPLVKVLTQYNDFCAKENDTVVLYPQEFKKLSKIGAKRVLMIGLGKKSSYPDVASKLEMFRSAGGTISKVCAKYKISELVIWNGTALGLKHAEVVQSLTEGIVLGDYQFNKYKAEDKENPVFKGIKKLTFSVSENVAAIRKSAKRGSRLALAACAARDMANEPGNYWTAAEFAEYAKKMAETHPVTCSIIDKAQMKKLGMGGLLAVNQGSAAPPKLVVLDYSPEKSNGTILLVGKGLTFDSGGISIKPSAGMQDMKYDMCGGAAVISAMQAIAEDKPDARVVALIPATDNMSGSSALKPGDVIRHFNGVTAEIVNTDAEGRLILADALAYGVKQYKPDCIVDVATLTGAVILGLGHHHSGILSNNDALAKDLIEAGKKCAEPLWRLPLGKEYSKQIESDVADIKNAGGRPAGTITAAAYLEKFIDDVPWAHLDIAGTAWGFTEKTYIPKGPSGIAVRTLVEFVRKRAKITNK